MNIASIDVLFMYEGQVYIVSTYMPMRVKVVRHNLIGASRQIRNEYE